MIIRLQYFAALRDLQAPAELEAPEGCTLQQLLETLFARVPALRDWDRHLLFAAGEEYVDRSHSLQAGELISLLPPVQGG
jgi:molybdopterin converting factor small subunit